MNNLWSFSLVNMANHQLKSGEMESSEYDSKHAGMSVLLGLQRVVVVEHGPVAVRPRHLDGERPRRPGHPSRGGLQRRHRRLDLPLLRRFKLESLHQSGEEEEDLEMISGLAWILRHTQTGRGIPGW